jgi:hypothetical protein
MSICNRLQNTESHTYFLGVFSVAISLIFSLLFTVYPAYAAPGKINYQGRLADATGTAKPDGQYNMKFRIYSAASGGTLLWSEVRETTNRVTVTNGQFNVQLGAVTTIPDSVFSADSTYFEVELPTPATATCSTASCGAYTEGAMTPRQAVSSAAYALQANNASTVDGIDSTSFARNDSFNTFSSSNTFNSTVALASTNSNLKFTIKDSGSQSLFIADTSAMVVRVGSLAAGTLANVRLITTSAEFSGTVRIGTATDGIDISGANGILLSGTARRAQSINLMPEYANSVLDAGSGSDNTGAMTTKLDLSTRRNYYKWTTSQGTVQSYDVVVQVPIPSDFSAWANTTPITIDTYTSNTTTGTITIQAMDTAGTIVSGMNFSSITPTAATAWQSRSPGTISGTFTPGSSMMLRIRMTSPASGDVRISTIKMDYLTKW